MSPAAAEGSEPGQPRRWGALSRPRVRQAAGAATLTAVLVLGGALVLSVVGSPSRAGSAALPRHHRPPAALRLVEISPPTHATGVSYSAPIELTFSTPLARHVPDPVITPTISGRWSHPSPKVLRFTPKENFLPFTVVHLFIRGGVNGLRASDGARLPATVETGFTVAGGSILRLQQLLAELHYLPVAFAPAGPGATAARVATALGKEPTNPRAVALSPVAGSLTWRFPNVPAPLRANFAPGAWDVATEGAVMAFQSEHHLDINGEPTGALWQSVLSVVAAHRPTARPYDYLLVTESQPETLYVWREGKVIYQTPVNTGVSGAPTALGTFPVYSRFTVTTMSGTNPDGSHYVDPGIPWVSYFNGGDAVHGFVRPGYGYPQSDGCVELPIGNAAQVYPLDPYGTLVTVTTGYFSTELGAAQPRVLPPPPPAPTNASAPTTTSTSTTTTTTTTPPRHQKPRRHPVATTTTATSTTTTTAASPSGAS
ncbi:MAG TPA: L,D-transpeptidase family protein [Acidimicrobiales bacterium]|nr:L,D-transpeptidase family protein [Acidimicrobiales bacterium]